MGSPSSVVDPPSSDDGPAVTRRPIDGRRRHENWDGRRPLGGAGSRRCTYWVGRPV